MTIYECTKCDWKGDAEEVETVQTFEFLGLDEDKVEEEDNEFLEVCPRCKPYQLAYRKVF